MSDAAVRPIGRRLAHIVLTVAAVTVVARAVGFLRVVVFAHTVGPSCLGDTYYTANTIPNILFDVVAGGALSSIVVPVLATPVEAGDNDTADRTASALLSWTVLLMLPLLVIGIVLAGPLMHLLLGNGNPRCSVTVERDVGARMLIVFMPQIVFYGMSVVLIGVLQSHRRFVGPALAPLVSSVVVITAYVIFGVVASRRETDLTTLTRAHELVLSAGTTLGVAALTVPLWLSLRRTSRRLRPTLAFPPGVAAVAGRMALAGAVVLGSQDLATAAILRLANDGGDRGSVVYYNLAWAVFLLPWSVLAVPLATTAFPTLTARWQTGAHDDYAATTARTTRVVVLVCGGAAAVLAATAQPAAEVLARGAPGGVPPDQLAWALLAFAPGLVAYGLVAILARSHYARGAARTTAVAAAVGWAVAVAADVALVATVSRSSVPAALAAGTDLGITVTALWLAVVLRRRVGRRAVAGCARTTVGVALAAAAAAALGRLVVGWLPTGGSIWSALVVAVGMIATGAVFVAAMAAIDRDLVLTVMPARLRRKFAH